MRFDNCQFKEQAEVFKSYKVTLKKPVRELQQPLQKLKSFFGNGYGLHPFRPVIVPLHYLERAEIKRDHEAEIEFCLLLTTPFVSDKQIVSGDTDSHLGRAAIPKGKFCITVQRLKKQVEDDRWQYFVYADHSKQTVLLSNVIPPDYSKAAIREQNLPAEVFTISAITNSDSTRVVQSHFQYRINLAAIAEVTARFHVMQTRYFAAQVPAVPVLAVVQELAVPAADGEDEMDVDAAAGDARDDVQVQFFACENCKRRFDDETEIEQMRGCEKCPNFWVCPELPQRIGKDPCWDAVCEHETNCFGGEANDDNPGDNA